MPKSIPTLLILIMLTLFAWCMGNAMAKDQQKGDGKKNAKGSSISVNAVSQDPVDKAEDIKKYLKFKIFKLLKRYIIIKNKKNLKKNTDFNNLFKINGSFTSKYKYFKKLKIVEKITSKKNKKIIFIKKLYLKLNKFDFKW